MGIIKFLLLNTLIFLWGCVSFASFEVDRGFYPWVPIYSDDLRVIDDVQVEVEFRLSLIRNAKRTIDLVIWDQQLDEKVGKPLLVALKEAAHRGVKIRFLTSWFGHMMGDPFSKVSHFLNRSPVPQTPIEFLIVGGDVMQRKKGWGYLDGIHEKMLIVDGKINLVTGRGHAQQYLKWLDTAFAMKGLLVDQSIQAFQILWETAQKECHVQKFNERTDSIVSGFHPEAFARVSNTSTLSATLSPDQLSFLNSLNQWNELSSSPSSEDCKGRLIHFDFLAQMRKLSDFAQKNPSKFSYEQRIEGLEDPFVNEIVQLISDGSAKDLSFYTLNVHLHPKLKKAILLALKQGLSVKIFTNGKSAQTKIVPLAIPFGWYQSLPDLDDLLQEGANAFGLLQKKPESAAYLHRKMAIIDDTVIFGSHNLNFSSTVESDELGYEIKCKAFAAQAQRLFQSDLESNAEEILFENVHRERKSYSFQQWFSDYLGGMY